MNVLLINPAYLKGYKQFSLNFPPLGCAYLAAILRYYGHQVQVLDLNSKKKSLPNHFQDFHLVGISSDTPRHNQALQLAAKVKNDNIPLVMGGPHASFQAEKTLQTGLVDYVIRNEGEYNFLSLLDHLGGRLELDRVPGVSYLSQGQTFHNQEGSFIQDIDSIPFPARDLLPMAEYKAELDNVAATSVISSRGCPFNCSFCSSSQLFGLKWRPRAPESIMEEIRLIDKQHGIRGIYFMDDNLTLNPDRTIALCELLCQNKPHRPWFCFSRVNTIIDREDMVQSMAESGCRIVFLGIESPNLEILQDYNKKITADESMQAVDLLKKYNISPMCSFIIGNPNEDLDQIKQTIEFAKKLKIEVAQFSILTPYPGTQLFDQVKDKQIMRDWSYYDGLHATIETNGIRPAQLEKILKKAYVSFYFNPRMLLSHPAKSLHYLFNIKHLFS